MVTWKKNFYKYFRQYIQYKQYLYLLNNICSGVFRLEVGYRLKLCNFFKTEFHYIHIPGYFPKFSLWLFQNTIMKTSVIEVRRVKGCRLWSCVLVKNWLHQRQFSEIKFSPLKNSVAYSNSGSNLQYFYKQTCPWLTGYLKKN